LEYGVANMPTEYFMEDKETPYIRANREENKIYFGENVSKSSFFKDLEIQPNDVLIAVNGKKYDLNNARYLFEVSKQWIKGTVILVTIRCGSYSKTNTN